MTSSSFVRAVCLVVVVGALCLASSAQAVTSTVVYDAALAPADVAFEPAAIFIDQKVRIYATVYNEGTKDVEGVVNVFDNGERIGAKLFSAKVAGKPDELWVSWTPKTVGEHTIEIRAVNDDEQPDVTPANNQVSVTRFVDRDTDNDGTGNTTDPDDDNDTVPDGQDQFPLDPTRSHDTDGDGTDDAVDSDVDNDGVYNWTEKTNGTSPVKYDTDSDGVGDKQDAFPLDPKRSAEEPKPIPAPVESKPATASEPLKTAVTSPRSADAGPIPAVLGVTIVADETVPPAPSEKDALPAEPPAPEVARLAQETNAPPAPIPAVAVEEKETSPLTWLWVLAGLLALGSFIFFMIGRRKEKEEEDMTLPPKPSEPPTDQTQA
ncbi:MAG: CARDB domain-containing protein [Patescibacteria group bacterium]